MTGVSREALIEKTAQVVHDIERIFTKPDDDWEPVAVFSCEDGMVVTPLDIDKSQWGVAILFTAKTINANAAALVLSSWQLMLEPDDPDKEEKLELARKIGVSQMEGRIEQVLITAIDQSGISTKAATIHRHSEAPPTLGEFHDIKDASSHIWNPLLKFFTEKGDT